jgi:hypothetical protein
MKSHPPLNLRAYQGRRVHDVVEALLPHRNATETFLSIFLSRKNIPYFKILINVRTYNTYNENIVSFNALNMSVILLLDIGVFS